MSDPGGMLQRCWEHDYRGRCIYMITITVDGRQPLLGRLEGGAEAPRIALSPLGRAVEACWRQIPQRWPGVDLLEYQVMPDHFHGIVFIKERQEKPLGEMMRGFKKGCSMGWRALQAGMQAKCGLQRNSPQLNGPQPNSLPPNGPPPNGLPPGGGMAGESGTVRGHTCPLHTCPPLWSPGYQDSILLHAGQLANMRAYVRDNPRRLAVKRAHPELFRIVRDLPLGGATFAAIGNHFLPTRPNRLQIQCSRSITPEALAAKQSYLLEAARHGAVLVSPCISPGEKQIARAALAARLPLIVLLENGFPPLYKPPKTYFEACAEGRLLMLAPWPYHADKRTITRAQCLALNDFTERICK